MQLGELRFCVNGHGKAGKVGKGWKPYPRVLGGLDSPALKKLVGLRISCFVLNKNNKSIFQGCVLQMEA